MACLRGVGELELLGDSVQPLLMLGGQVVILGHYALALGGRRTSVSGRSWGGVISSEDDGAVEGEGQGDVRKLSQ